MEMRYPRWPNALYFSCWNMVLLPKGGSFYGGFASHLNSDDLFFFANHGQVAFEEIRVRPLQER